MKSIIKRTSFIIGFLIFSSILFAKDIGLYMPYGLFQTQGEAIYITETYYNRILKLEGDKIEVVAGKNAMVGSYKDAAVTEARFNQPLDLTINSKGEIFVADSENHAIRKIAGGQVTTVSGDGKPGYGDGDRVKGKFNLPSGIAVDSKDNLYIADTLNHVIRKISPDGKVSTLAGKATKNGHIDGTVDKALFNEPTDIAVTKQGIIYVVDSGNHTIRKIEEGKVTTVNGFSKENLEDKTYRLGGYTDGKEAQFNFPKSLVVLDSGEILVTDMMNNALRKIKMSGEVVTLLNSANDLEAPVGVIYKNNKFYVSQKWKAGLKEFTPGEEKVVKTAISHEKWLEITPYDTASQTIQIWFEGHKINTVSQGAQVIGKEAYIPIRTLAEAVGGELKWDAKLKAVVITLNGKTMTIPTNKGKTKLVQTTLLGEIKYLETMLGIKIDWVEPYRAIVVSR